MEASAAPAAERAPDLFARIRDSERLRQLELARSEDGNAASAAC